MKKNNKILTLNCVELLKYQPNRYPFLMIDCVSEVKPGFFANGYKNFTNNEWFFSNHFPGGPNVPGALQLEALVQMLTIAVTTLPGNKGKIFHGLNHNVKFKREILPGDKFDIKTKIKSWKRGICIGSGRGFVNDILACEAEMTICLPDALKSFLPKNK